MTESAARVYTGGYSQTKERNAMSETTTTERRTRRAGAEPQARPKLVLPLGRGSRGKTVLLRWAVDRARQAGREVVLADVDRTNQGLKRFFPDALSPPSASDAAVREWLGHLLEDQIARKYTLCLDLGGGDLLLKQMARDLDLAAFLAEYDVEPVAIHMLGADIEDLSYMASVEERGVFAPPQTAVVFNLGVAIGNRDPLTAFAPVAEHPITKAVLDRGAILKRLTRLDVMHEVDERVLLFSAAADGAAGEGKPLGPIARTILKKWLRTTEDEFRDIDHMLP